MPRSSRDAPSGSDASSARRRACHQNPRAAPQGSRRRIIVEAGQDRFDRRPLVLDAIAAPGGTLLRRVSRTRPPPPRSRRKAHPCGAVTASSFANKTGHGTHDGRMADEIERKFLMAAVPDAPVPEPGVQLRQGYRRSTVPWRCGSAACRKRTGSPSRPAEASPGRRSRCSSTRPMPRRSGCTPSEGGRGGNPPPCRDLDAGLVAEIDRYAGALEGLSTVEVEFPNAEQAEAFDPPAWFGPELTGDPRWSNAELARLGSRSSRVASAARRGHI